MKCLSTYNCNNEAKYVKEINCSNFCSYECYLIYKGEKKPPVPKRRIFEDPERQQLHDLYIWARGGKEPDWVKKKRRFPPIDEWITTLSDGSTYLYDDFQHKFVRYVLGYGLFNYDSKRCKYVLWKDENSEYYRAVIKRINEVQCNPELAYEEPAYKPKIKRGVGKRDIRGLYKTKKKKNKDRKLYTKICPCCGREFTTNNKAKIYDNNACKQRNYQKRKLLRDIKRKKAELVYI